MTDEEYTSALDYLLNKLRDMQQPTMANEITALINRGKTLTVKDSPEERKITKQGIGKTTTLPFSPKEALEFATDYLAKIIIEVPSYAKAIQNKFGDNITWEYEKSQVIDSLEADEGFAVQDLLFSEDELNEARLEVSKIKKYMEE